MSQQQDIANLLFEQKGDITINDVEFHKFILNTKDYFKGYFNFNKSETDIVLKNEEQELFSYESIVYLKNLMYCQEMNFKLETVEDSKLIVELENLGDLLQIKIISKVQIQKLVNKCQNMEILQLMYMSITDLLFTEYFDKHIDMVKLNFDMLNSTHIYVFAYYLKSSTCCKDIEKGCNLFKKNWEENKHTNSLNKYATCLQWGIGCNRDQKKAFELYKINWEKNNNAVALDSYAHCLMYGEGCEKDEKEAIKLFKLGCEKNHPNSIHTCAVWTMEGLKGCKKDEKEKHLDYLN